LPRNGGPSVFRIGCWIAFCPVPSPTTPIYLWRLHQVKERYQLPRNHVLCDPLTCEKCRANSDENMATDIPPHPSLSCVAPLPKPTYFDPHNTKIPRRSQPRAHNPSIHAIRNAHMHLFSLWNGQKTASQLWKQCKAR
jgi:hypothetical protein